MSQQLPALHHTIVVVDVAAFTDPVRTMIHHNAVQEGLYRVLRGAFAEAGVDWAVCVVEDRGDGALILVPPTVAKSRLVDQLPGRLVAELRRYNAIHSTEAAIKLRVGLHAGDVYRNEHGAVSPAVNLASRLPEVPEAKSALQLSAGVLALVASDSFYQDVIHHDPAADPGSYRRITVSVKQTSAVGWLYLPGETAAAGWTVAGGQKSRVRNLLPMTELQRLHELLVDLTFPQLPMLVRRAVGPGASPELSAQNAWDAFSHLADFNAGPDGFPPALMFVELVARQVGGDLQDQLIKWNDEQAGRLRLIPQLNARRATGKSAVQIDSCLYLVIAVQHDGIDPDRYLLSYWRQDDPEQWPPARGETRLVTLDELERHVDELVVSAERMWAGCGRPVTLEFVLPRELLSLPVHRWHKEHNSGDPRPLCLDYPIVVRSLERMRSPHWHRAWHQRWQILRDDPSATWVHFGRPSDIGERYRIDAVLSDPRCVLMVLTTPPTSRPQPGADELAAALRSGLPALVWHPEKSSDLLREIVAWLVEGDGVSDLPGRAHASRRAKFLPSAVPFDVNVACDLVILWDDPHRLVALDQSPSRPLPPRGDIADERERAS